MSDKTSTAPQNDGAKRRSNAAAPVEEIAKESLVPTDSHTHIDQLSPGAVLSMQRLVGNRATQRWIKDRSVSSKANPAIQRAVYLANEDDYIYKSEEVDGEFAYLMKLAGKLPIFIDYAAIDKLKANAKLQSMWNQRAGVEEYFRDDLAKLLESDDADAKMISGLLGKVYVYYNDTGLLSAEDPTFAQTALVIAAAITGGAKAYQMGGGSRLPSAVGFLVVNGLSTKKDALLTLGIPEEKHGDYSKLIVRFEKTYQTYLSKMQEAKKSGVNYYAFANLVSSVNMYYVSWVEVKRNANAKIQVEGTRYSDDDFFKIDPLSEEGGKIKTSHTKIGTPTADTGWVKGTKISKKDRGEGQAKAMNNWNALGAAAYANHFLDQKYPLDQNWEWLHVRGAQIGGVTDNTNLIPGLYVTNSFMIPYEDMILHWAQADGENFEVRFSVYPTGTLYARYITLEIKAKGHKILGDLPASKLVTFDAHQGKVVDKLANEFIKRSIDQRVAIPSF